MADINNLYGLFDGVNLQQSVAYDIGRTDATSISRDFSPGSYSPFLISLVAPTYAAGTTTRLFNRVRAPSLLGNNQDPYVNPIKNLSTSGNQVGFNANYGRNISPRETQDADESYLQALNRQLDLIKATPALLMLAAPERMTRSYEPTLDYAKGRKSTIVSMWLERPMTITASGKTLAQYVLFTSGGGGLTNINRTSSKSYANLLSLIQIYRNNGWVIPDSTNLSTNSNNIPAFVGAVAIEYDGRKYLGSFDSFSVTDDAKMPFQLSYDFSFTVRYEFITLNQG
jgi:hypothetical protein